MFHRHHQQDEEQDAGSQPAPGSGGSPAGQKDGPAPVDADLQKVYALITRSEALATDRTRSRVTVSVTFPDGRRAELQEELPNLYQPPADSPDAKRLTDFRATQQVRHTGKIPKLQLEIAAGSKVRLVHDPNDRKRLLIDEEDLHKRAVNEYIEQQKRAAAKKAQATPAVITGPPWEVPAHCPNCGAPVDQATASKAQDPACRFCSQPIPAKPLALSQG